jgi:hypothetical protein
MTIKENDKDEKGRDNIGAGKDQDQDQDEDKDQHQDQLQDPLDQHHNPTP